jgi:hypothetical protein
MIIQHRGITPSEGKQVSAALDRCWSEPHAVHTESSDLFSELSHGPECFEIEVGGDKWTVHDRRSKYPVFLDRHDETGRLDHCGGYEVAYGPLFDAVRELVPKRDRIEWYQDRHHLMKAALKCAAATSDENGHEEQAQQFRDLYQEMEDAWDMKPRRVLDTPAEIWEKVRDRLPEGAQHASGGLLDANGLSDVDVIIFDEDIEPGEDKIFVLHGYDRPVHVRSSCDLLRLRSVDHRRIELKLESKFPALTEKARAAKADGLSTEAAWANVLGLEGDPYEAMADEASVMAVASTYGGAGIEV